MVGLPLAAGEALSLGDLFGGHLGGDNVAVLDAEVSCLTGTWQSQRNRSQSTSDEDPFRYGSVMM